MSGFMSTITEIRNSMPGVFILTIMGALVAGQLIVVLLGSIEKYREARDSKLSRLREAQERWAEEMDRGGPRRPTAKSDLRTWTPRYTAA